MSFDADATIQEEADRLEETKDWQQVRWLDNVFSYHAPNGDDINKYAKIRSAGRILAEAILENCPPCADRTAAVRKVRESVMTANSSIALKGMV